jgi:hypothetical protein
VSKNESSKWIGKLYEVTADFVSFTVPERKRIEHKFGALLLLVEYGYDTIKLLTASGAIVLSYTETEVTFSDWVRRGVLTPVLIPLPI